MSLSDKVIRDAKAKTSVYRLRDANVVCRGFGVTIAPSGSKTFFLSYTSPVDGKRKQVALGRYPKLGLREARIKAAKMRAEVDAGDDPALAKIFSINQKIEKRKQGTLSELIDTYIEDLEMDGKRTAKEVLRIKNKDIPVVLLSRPAHALTKDDILNILTPITQRGAPVHSDNVRTYLRAAFEFGLNAQSSTRWRGIAPEFGLEQNPVASIRKSVPRKRRGQRSLSPSEIKTLWNTNLLSAPMLLAMKFILSTGQRVEEVLHATWSEFNIEECLWIIPGDRRKTRAITAEPHLVPLTDLHLGLLDEIRKTTQHSEYLFPQSKGAGPRRYDSLTHATRSWVTKAGISSFSPRDLRRTFKSVAGSFGISLEMRNRLQGHALTDVGSVHYDRYDYLTEKKEAMKLWSSELQKIIVVSE
ncbi:MAG: integrase arm-type DNA-binding domain-containing protein [Rhodospirillaceae bacterium]|jgi:integrase